MESTHAAALLKLTTDWSVIPTPVTASVPSWAFGLAPLFELGLGLWLMSGICRYGAWLVILPVMILFALQSLALTIESQSSCGCFGGLTVSPVITLVFDVVAIAMFIRFRPGWQGWPSCLPATRVALQTVAVAGLLTGGVIAWAYASYGSIGVAVAAARGEPIAVSPDRLDLGLVQAGDRVERTLRVVNLSDEPVQLALVLSNCNCTQVGGLPAALEPGTSLDLPVTVTVGRKAGKFRVSARLRTSAGDVVFSVTASVTTDPNGPGVSPGQEPKEDPR